MRETAELIGQFTKHTEGLRAERLADLPDVSIDQPSSRFASFGDPRIAAVGLELDTKPAEISQLMSLCVPAELERDAS